MTKDKEKQKEYVLWVDSLHKIISFKYEDGFKQLNFMTSQEKFEFAMEKSSSGYRIQ